MKIDVFYLRVICTCDQCDSPTDSSDKNPIDAFYYIGVLVCTIV